MSTNLLTRIIMGVTISILIVIIAWFWYKDNTKKNTTRIIETPIVQNVETPQEVEKTSSTDRLKDIEDTIAELQNDIEKQNEKINTLTSDEKTETTDVTTIGKQIFSVAQAKGTSFSTTASSYTPMGVYTNITCPESCTLWINFYTTSNNDSPNNVNTYGLFVNGTDQSLYNQATIPNANGATPISLNGTVTVSAGTHTVEIKSKTSGGTMKSDVSFLQVMAIEK